MKYHFYVFGCGGTGSLFLGRFGQFLASASDSFSWELTLIDGDVVERKNLSRQFFTLTDLGQNKALASCAILEEVFGIQAHAYPHFVTDASWFSRVTCSEECIPVFFGCVDNHHCRKLLEEAFASLSHCFYFDSANEFSDGEIVTGIRLNGKTIAPVREFYFPNYATHAKAVTSMSCQELNAVAPQHIAVNNLAAALLLAKATRLCEEQRIDGGITHFNASLCQVSHTLFSPELVKAKQQLIFATELLEDSLLREGA